MRTIFLFLSLIPIVFAQLEVGFYNSSCPQAESIIKAVVEKHLKPDPSITAALLRMHFHDCFVRGCDASILIDSKANKPSEKMAGPNLSIRGYGLIDEAKRRLEKACPQTVSCADIITVMTRDAVAFAGGPNYAVPTGRRDGLVSNPQEVNLPGPSFSVSRALESFTDKGLILEDMVVLLGAHTVGVAHCTFFRDRLFNFQGTGAADPSMDPNLVAKLRSICGSASRPFNSDPTAFLDQNTSFVIDNEFYNQIHLHKGILKIDQELDGDASTAGIVASLRSDGARFWDKFASAMVKMGNIEVLVGNNGEIRRNCRVFNS